MNNIDKSYQILLQDILDNGIQKGDRTGTGTISVFGRQIRHKMSEGFPLLTTKKMHWKSIVTELLWFLRGDTNIKFLLDYDCHIWDGDAYKVHLHNAPIGHQNYLTKEEFTNKIKTDSEFAKVWGELGPIYGAQWRDWQGFKQGMNTMANSEYPEEFDTEGVDQIANLINQLKTNPDSRRMMVNAWNVGELNDMVLPPCHYGFQCYVSNGELSLMWNQRSVDTFLGLPFTIASYGTLLLLLCEETGYKPGELIGNLGDVHLYKNHTEQAQEQINRPSFELPTIELSNVDVLNGEFDYNINGYRSHQSIKAPLSN